MKKVLAIILCLTVISACFIIPSFSAGELQTAEFLNGTPEIDGKIDESWSLCKAYSMQGVTAGDATDTTATFRGMWDQNNIYILAEVKDSTLYHEAGSFKTDGVELYFDPALTKADTYDADATTGYICFGADNDADVEKNGSGTWDDCYTWAVTYTDTGYIIEIKTDLNKYAGVTFAENKTIGFELHVCDYPAEGGGRTCAFGWNDLADSAWEHPSSFGEVKLMAAPAVAEDAPQADAAPADAAPVASEPEAKTTSPQTLDLSEIALVLLSASFGGFVCIKKNKKR